ncbi:polysaccharide deacetylase family protein [Streptomyces sp. NBC_00988]|jgi:peptidoglycan/xylan/chitin deacetylase (PgdA/CDA1 family)|uniref:polysaccharide deacetylase family protein n=1 Tax=Streptomyces sp. NBC_00988 TaxID=2903704 RepID=UPI00386508DE|nr:polysaccharide deacetylase family protein [Streptomyces sp. NBC_00988]
MSEDRDPSGFMYPSSRIPYRNREGKSLLPGGAKLACLIYIAPEQWQWGVNEKMDVPAMWRHGEEYQSWSTRTAVQYGFNVGLYRMQDVFKKHDVKITLWTNGTVVEQNFDVIKELADYGHELGGHSYSEGHPMPTGDRAFQEDSIKRSIDLLTSVTGRRPLGWLGPGAKADQNTIELIADHGFTYNGDLQDDELPYFLHVGDKTLTVIPYRFVGNFNDLLLTTTLGAPRSVGELTSYVVEGFDAYHDAAQTHPLIFNYGMHTLISGRPDNIKGLEALIERARSYDDVWIGTYGELAEFWHKEYSSLIPEGGGDIIL